jgi:hypothetical protein
MQLFVKLLRTQTNGKLLQNISLKHILARIASLTVQKHAEGRGKCSSCYLHNL